MPAKRYDWKRYWIPKEKELPLDADGFLLDPQECPTFGWSQTNDAVGFDSLIQAPCLVLLGEPGMGKSDTVKMAEVLTREAVEGAGGQVLLRNLGAYNTDAGLVESVFRSDQFMDWRAGRCQLHLFLDSLDECRISIQGVAKLLSEKLRDLPNTNNLFLRITCRIGDWPESLETALIEKWGDSVPRILILAPLTRPQVTQAARDEGQDADAFVEAVTSRELVPFARSPLTLRFLLSSWAKSGCELPKSLREIYEDGCRELCADLPERAQDKHRPSLSIEDRMAVASHIAAGLIFGGLQEVWVNPSVVGQPAGTLSLADLTDKQVTTRKGVTAVTEPALRLVLDSGLFTSRGAHLHTWAHKTYAEFLAARWLEGEGLKPKQILDLLTSPVDGEGKLVPQLHQTAAWAAKPGTELYEHLANVQPDILLGSDLATEDSSSKAALLEAILKSIAKDEVNTRWWENYQRWRKLLHPGMAAVLRERLIDTRVAPHVRKAAIRIASSCALRELVPDLIRIALDPAEDPGLREIAAHEVVNLGDSTSYAALRPLALRQAGPDPEHVLQGIALDVCWPAHLTAEELFGSLVPPIDGSDFRYRSFLGGEWPLALRPDAVVLGLNWLRQIEEDESSDHETPWSLLFKLLDASGAHLQDNQVLRALVGVICGPTIRGDSQPRIHASSLATRLEADADLRHRLTEIALAEMPNPAEKAWTLIVSRMPLVLAEDTPWLVQRLSEATKSAMGRAWANLVVVCTLRFKDVHGIHALLASHALDPKLEELCPELLKPVILGSQKATQLKLEHEAKRSRPAVKPEFCGPTLPVSEAIRLALSQFEEGDLTCWLRICLALAEDKNGEVLNFLATWDPRKGHGWTSLASNLIPRLERAAEHYLMIKPVEVGPWFSKRGRYPKDLIAGLHALVLLQGTSSSPIAPLPTEVWNRWIPAILRIPECGSGENRKHLVAAALKSAPGAAEEWMVKAIDAAVADQSGFEILAWIPDPVSRALSQHLLGYITSVTTEPSCVGQLLGCLWQRQLPGLVDWVAEWLGSGDATTPIHEERTLVLCGVLIAGAEAEHWHWVWSVMERSDSLGKSLFSMMAERGYPASLPRILLGVEESDIVKLWEWAVRLFPPDRYPEEHKGSVSSNEQIGGFRNQLLMYLCHTGTSGSCEQLSRLAQDYPQFSWVRQLERQAFANRRKNEWQPIDPKLLFQMPRSPRSRWVESEPQLLDVILDSLERCEGRLQGTNPLARMLWNDAAKSKRPTPKQEDAVSDWVTSELRRDLQAQGIVLNREVVVRPADRLDILVEAICPDSKTNQFQSIRVIIEVKRDVNAEIDHAMKTQLSERYLADNGCHTGLYLVAWFNRNRQRGEKAQERLREFRAKLEAQAAKESSAGKNLRAWVLDCCLPKPSK